MSWERLGDEVRLRRTHLNLTQPEMAARGKLSVTKLGEIESKRAGVLSPRLRRSLELALYWEPGSIDAVLAGRTPTPNPIPADELTPDPLAFPDERSAERLGDAVWLRRTHLNLTQAEMAERGQLGERTIRAIESKRVHRLIPRVRQGLERALDWEPGSVDAVLNGLSPTLMGPGKPTIPGTRRKRRPQRSPEALPSDQSPVATTESFDKARWLLKMRRSFSRHRDGMDAAARDALETEFTSAAREMEEALILMLPWLGDGERAAAIRILAELRDG